MLRDLFDAVLRLIFGHGTTDRGKDWYQAHHKTQKSRAEVDAIIAKAEREQQERR